MHIPSNFAKQSGMHLDFPGRYKKNGQLYTYQAFKLGAGWPHGALLIFLKLHLCGCQYVCLLRVYAPEGFNNYSHETKPE